MEEARYVHNPLLTQDSSYYEDEVTDTLSLSDFLIYDYNGHDPQDFYQLNDHNNHNLEVDHDQSFEFSSELLKTSGGDNVVFCGKIIPYKESNAVFQNTTHKLESKKEVDHKSYKRRWNFLRLFKKSSKPKSNFGSEKVDLKYEVPNWRSVSILASATKPRWYMLMFGFRSTSFPAQMHIKDLKKAKTESTRRNKNSKNNNKISGGSGGGSGIGSWRLATLLGCGGGGGGSDSKHHPNAIMKIEQVS